VIRSCGRPVFIGRKSGVAGLRLGYGSAVQRTLALVLVEGASGIGKTALVERFLDQLTAGADRLASLLSAAAAARARDTAFKAFDSIVDGLSASLASLALAMLRRF